jgi:hypothetical protein
MLVQSNEGSRVYYFIILNREYAMVGDIVNLSARLMVNAKSYILTDEPTYEAGKLTFTPSYKIAKYSANLDFEKKDPIKVKGSPSFARINSKEGKLNLVPIYVPTRRKGRTDTKLKAFKSAIVGR